jgi:hypothetical protein
VNDRFPMTADHRCRILPAEGFDGPVPAPACELDEIERLHLADLWRSPSALYWCGPWHVELTTELARLRRRHTALCRERRWVPPRLPRLLAAADGKEARIDVSTSWRSSRNDRLSGGTVRGVTVT